LNILILNHYASTPKHGSAETRHYEIAKRLVKRGHEVIIAVGDYSHLLGKKWSELTDSFRFLEDGIEFQVIKTRFYTGNGVDRLLSSYDYYKNGKTSLVVDNVDIIVASSPHPFTWPLAHYLSKKRSIPFLIEIRDVWPDDLISMGALKKSHPVVPCFRHLCRKYYPRSEGIISLVPDLNEHFKSLKLKTLPRLYVIPNGIDISVFENPKKCPEAEIILSKVPQGTLKVLYTGSHGPSNGLINVLKQLAHVPPKLRRNFSFIFVGRGPEKSKLISFAVEEKLSNVFFFDPIPKECIYYLISCADVLLFSLLPFEGTKFPAYSSFKLMDYMASGKPIISVNLQGLILKETQGAIFYDIYDSESFESALKLLLNTDMETLKKMGERNKRYIQKNRDWSVIAEKFEEVLKEVST